MKGHFGPGRMNMYVIKHLSSLAKHWICSRERRQSQADEVYVQEGCCEQKSSIIENNIEITSTPAFCQVTPAECRELRMATLFLILRLYGIVSFSDILSTGFILFSLRFLGTCFMVKRCELDLIIATLWVIGSRR